MVLQEYKPSPALSGYVRTFRLVQYEYKADGRLPAKAYPPRPEHCLSFYARDAEQVEYDYSRVKTGNMRTVLFGQQTEVSNRLVGSVFLLIQVVFKPGALFRLTGIPSGELTNQYIDAETVFSADIKFVNDQINDCVTYVQMIGVVERFLLGELSRRAIRPVHALDGALGQLFGRDAVPNVDWLAAESCLSIRQFERAFNERMGVSPKYYLNVLRFENAFRLRNKYPELDWLSIALQCGFYDYQHLAKNYKALTGYGPNQFHQLDANGPERLFGEADTY